MALYTDAFPEEGHKALDARGILKQHVAYLLPSTPKEYTNDPRFYDCWSKLTPFSLTEYERVVQLDSDMLVLNNMDELMELDLDPPSQNGDGNRVFACSHACTCNPLKKPHYPKEWSVIPPRHIKQKKASTDSQSSNYPAGHPRTAHSPPNTPIPLKPKRTAPPHTPASESPTAASKSSTHLKASTTKSSTSSQAAQPPTTISPISRSSATSFMAAGLASRISIMPSRPSAGKACMTLSGATIKSRMCTIF